MFLNQTFLNQLKLVIASFITGGLVFLTASSYAQDAGLYSSEEMGQRALPGEDSVAEQLMDERRALENRERNINDKEALLRESEARLRDEIAENQRLRNEIQTMLDQLDEIHTEEIAGQIRVYERMRGSQAAPILTAMEADTVIPILRGMRPDKAAKILAAMNPRVAASLSERLNAPPAAELSR